MEAKLKQLNEDGFIIIDILNSDEIKYLNELCEKFLHYQTNDFIAGSHFLNKTDSDFINHELHNILKEKMQYLFPQLVLMGGTLATKKQGKSALKAHNDWDIVDERKHHSYNLWIALVNTNKQNGTLGLIPNSHLWQHKHRGANISSNFERFTNQLIKIGIEPNLKAGQAILYNHRLIHYSKPNTTNQGRNVAIVGMKEHDAILQVSFSEDKKTVATYEVNESDFYPFDIEKIKTNSKLISIENETHLYSNWNEILSEYNKYIKHYYIKKDSNIISKIKNKFTKILLR